MRNVDEQTEGESDQMATRMYPVREFTYSYKGA